MQRRKLYMQNFLLAVQDNLDAISREVQPRMEVVEGSPKRRKRAPERQVSPTAKIMLQRYFPEAPAEMSEVNLLLQVTAMHVPYWQHTWYPLLANLVKALLPCVGTQRVVFSQFTALFKEYWAPREGLKGPHVMEAKRWLKADREKVNAYIEEVERKLVERLQDVYVESYSDMERKVQSLAISQNPQEYLLAVLLAAGMRRGEVLAPHIRYEEFKGDVDPRGPYAKVDARFLLLQVGCFKDANSHANKYLRGSPVLKQIVKPTVFLDAAKVVTLIERYRREHGGEYNTKHSMVKHMKKYFPQAHAQAEQNGWPFGPHYCRRIYGTLSYERWCPKNQWDRSVWLSTVLAHGASVATSLSYSNVRVCMEDEEMPGLEELPLIKSE